MSRNPALRVAVGACVLAASICLSCLPRSGLSAAAQERKDTTVKKSSRNSITYFGRSSVKIVSASGIVVYVDPFAPGDYSEPADFIAVTHGHSDHNRIGLVTKKASCVIIAPLGAVTVKDYTVAREGDALDFGSGDARLKVLAVAAYNSNHQRESCVGYVLDFGGMKIYHGGDTSKIPEMAALVAGHIDYALLPCDGYYNMGTAEFAQSMALIKPRFAIPIHSSAAGSFDEAAVAKISLSNLVVVQPGSELALK